MAFGKFCPWHSPKGDETFVDNILYITYVAFVDNAFSGVRTKIIGQITAMQEQGFHVDRINQYGKAAQLVDCSDNTTQVFSFPFFRRFSLLKAVEAALSQRQYTAAYIRFQFFSEDVRRITALLKKKGVRVVLEIPTYPYEQELHQQGPKGEVKLFCDRIFRKSCLRNIDRIATVSHDKQIMGLPCINILNGLDFSSHPLRTVRQPQENEAHLIAVASMSSWHGYDRLLMGLANYYKDSSRKFNFVFHLVGEGKESGRYRQIVAEQGLEEHVVFHGKQRGEALHEIASGCDIAVGCLGCFRSGITYISALKSREYCAWGLPSVNATPTDILDPKDPNCLFVPDADIPVDMEEVESFYRRVYFRRNLPAEQIAGEIRAKAEALSDVRRVFIPVMNFFREK